MSMRASERAGLHTIFATGAASTTGRACAMYCFVLSKKRETAIRAPRDTRRAEGIDVAKVVW